jgi:hypothetical protein|tara:strand:- start:607 stop:1173 length:567 start_codon:yes stop_codon:yes gene_type:complete
MSCQALDSGRKLGCKNSVGGLQNVYFAGSGDISAVLFNDVGATPGEVLSFTATASSIFKYELVGSNTFTETITSSDSEGTTFVEQSLTMNLQILDNATLNQVKLLAFDRPKIFVEDRNGHLLFLGIKNGMSLTTGTLSSGDGFGDASGFTLEFTGQEKLQGIHVASGILNTSFDGALATATFTPAIPS